MGYRSNVAYTIRFHWHGEDNPHWGVAREGDTPRTREQAETLFKMFLAEAKSKEDTRLCFEDVIDAFGLEEGGRSFREGMMVDEKNLRINFYVTDVKWYESYTDVKCHLELLNLAREYAESAETRHIAVKNEKGETVQAYEVVGYAFTRIGENHDDVAEDYGGDCDYDWVMCSRQLVTDFV